MCNGSSSKNSPNGAELRRKKVGGKFAIMGWNPLWNKEMAEREGIEPTKDRLPFNGFENRGDHQARSTLRD